MAITVDIRQTDIDYAKAFIQQYLRDKIPEGDFSEGTALLDLTCKSIAHVFAFLKSELSRVKTIRSLSELYDMDDDEEVQQAVDEIISNFFLNRGAGAKARVSPTIVLSRKEDVFLGKAVSLNRDDTHIFFPIQDYFIDSEDLIEVITTTGVTTYEVDIIAEAEDIGSEYEVEPGKFVSWDDFNPYVIEIRNDQKGSGGDSTETSKNYIDRANDAITVRNLINKKSTRTVLLEGFKDYGLKEVATIGYGDSEMHRDKINTYVSFTKTGLVHIGNHQDIYLNLPLSEDNVFESVSYKEVKLGEPERNGAIKLPQVPIYKIHSVQDSSTLADLPYTLFVRDYRYCYTSLQEVFIILNSGVNGQAVTVTYDTVSSFDLIHTYLTDPDERIVLANSLAKAAIPIYIEANISYSAISGRPEFDEDAGIETVLEHIDSVSSTDRLKVDSFVKAIHTNHGEDIIIHSPVILKGTVLYPNGTSQVFYSENILSVPEYISIGVTNRVCAYISSKRYILFNKLS